MVPSLGYRAETHVGYRFARDETDHVKHACVRVLSNALGTVHTAAALESFPYDLLSFYLLRGTLH